MNEVIELCDWLLTVELFLISTYVEKINRTCTQNVETTNLIIINKYRESFIVWKEIIVSIEILVVYDYNQNSNLCPSNIHNKRESRESTQEIKNTNKTNNKVFISYKKII